MYFLRDPIFHLIKMYWDFKKADQAEFVDGAGLLKL